MKGFGTALIGFGLIVIFSAYSMDTGVSLEAIPSALGLGYGGTRQVHNLGLLQKRELTFQTGALMTIVGSILLAAGNITSAVVSSRSTTPAPPAAPPRDPEEYRRRRSGTARDSEEAFAREEYDFVDADRPNYPLRFLLTVLALAVLLGGIAWYIDAKETPVVAGADNAVAFNEVDLTNDSEPR